LRLVLTEPNPKLPGTQPFLFHESKSNLDKREVIYNVRITHLKPPPACRSPVFWILTISDS